MNVCMIGAGELGSRHLQAIGKSQYPLNIFVVDPSEESLRLAKKRFDETSLEHHRLTLLHTIDDLPKKLFFVVIATTSQVRFEVVEKLFQDNFQIDHLLLEKFLFPSLQQFDDAAKLFKTTPTKVYVNCGRRIVAFYQQIKLLFEPANVIHFKVEGTNIGIGCNGVHFLDWFSYMIQDKQLTLSSRLDHEILPSKRAGYMEFTGEIFGNTDHRDQFSLISYPKNYGSSPTMIMISSDQVKCMINESKCEAWVMQASKDWKLEHYTYRIPFQSEMTNGLVEQLIRNEPVCLPSYEISMNLHKQLLNQFLGHLQAVQGKEVETCLVT
jgi:hypothetical protein